MNEKSLEVVNQYDLNVYRVVRGRGGMILSTDKGVKLLCECNRPDSYYEREHNYSRFLSENGFDNIDTFFLSKSGKLVEELETDGRRYIIKNWFEGRECDVTNLTDVLRTVSALARLHSCFNKLSQSMSIADENEDENNQLQIIYDCERHTKEIKAAWNYLKTKKKRVEFEQMALKNISDFYDEAVNATNLLKTKELQSCMLRAVENNELCHGDFNYHNVIFSGHQIAIVGFNRVKRECQVWDLYEFMRKILEKYSWNIELAYKMIEEYNNQKPLSDEELKLLYVLLSYPEKFWKIINYYMNKNKALIPQKNTDKLETLIKGQRARWEFLATTDVL